MQEIFEIVINEVMDKLGINPAYLIGFYYVFCSNNLEVHLLHNP